MPFIFSAVELCVVTINEKPWTRAKEVCKALEYSKASKTEDIVKRLCSQENFTHKCQLIGFVSETKPVNWPKDSQKYDIYINEEGMYELLFSSQQPKPKNFRKHCYNVMFPQIRQQLTNKLKEDHQQAINQIQALEFTNEEERQVREQGILRLTEETRIGKEFTHTALFDVSTSSWKNISDGLNFVTQAWRWLTNVMIQTLFIDGVDLSVK